MIWPKSLSNVTYVESSDETELLSYEIPIGLEFTITQMQFFKSGSIDYNNMPNISIELDGEKQDVDPSLLLLTTLASNLKFTARKRLRIYISNASGLTVGVYVEGYLQEVKKDAA